ncbi:AMP-binding protein [Amycolatopsis sp. NPDC059090]|uniref:AMP-binding protein n=1 Tax=unclassified Amycolatopsis TaxID=2618356 RepID=UPI0036710725
MNAGVHARFLRGLELSPARTAIRTGDRTAAYEEVHDSALRWAGTLLGKKTKPPAAIGVLGGKGIEAYIGLLAALYAGATAVPLPASFPAARIRHMIKAAGVSALLADEDGFAVLDELEPRLPVLAPSRMPVDPADALPAPRPVAATDCALVLFTSGSTGRPKGVRISHGSLDHYFRLMAKRYDFTPADAFSQTFELNFDCAIFDLFCAWGAGATVHAVPATAYLDLPGFIAERGITVWFSTPNAISLVRKTSGLPQGAMPSLRWSFFAGEALQAADVVDWQRAATGSIVENLYGPTELTITVTGHQWSPLVSPGLCVNGLVPIGSVHEDHDYVLLTPSGEVAPGEGELCLTGPQLASGYLDPADGVDRFVRRDSRTWYRTGDRVRLLDNGELAYLGRSDAQVQVQGWRVELAEVEHALRACAEVSDAVVVTRPASSGLELVAFYTGKESPPVELARRMRRMLPEGMVPKHYRHLAEFPLNANRKVDRGRLARMAAR